MTTATAAPAAAQGAKNAQAPVMGPFRGGTQPTVRATGYTQTVTMTTATQPLPDLQVPPSNILREIVIEVTGTTTSNAATVVFGGDAPLNIFSTVNFQDAGGNSIVGSFDSYTLAMAMKYFGYAQNGDPRNNAVYSATAGVGSGAGGSFNFVLRIPVEAVHRTGVGSLQNQTTQSPFVLSLTMNASTAVYSTPPTTLPSVVVKVSVLGYWNGSNAAYSPTPKVFGSTQYVNRATISGLSGAQQFQLPNNGLGNSIRNIMFMNYTTGARNASNFPDPIQITYKGNNLLQTSQNLWKAEMSRAYDLGATTLDTANGLDTAVYVLPFDWDFGLAPGAELGLGYLVTNVGDEIEVIGSFGSTASNLYEVVNYISPNGPATALASGLA